MNKQEALQALGQRVRMLRNEQKLSIRAFGLMVGLSKDYIVDIEKGRKSPTLDTIMKISAGFDMTPSDLLDGIGSSFDLSSFELVPSIRHAPSDQGCTVRYHSIRL